MLAVVCTLARLHSTVAGVQCGRELWPHPRRRVWPRERLTSCCSRRLTLPRLQVSSLVQTTVGVTCLNCGKPCLTRREWPWRKNRLRANAVQVIRANTKEWWEVIGQRSSFARNAGFWTATRIAPATFWPLSRTCFALAASDQGTLPCPPTQVESGLHSGPRSGVGCQVCVHGAYLHFTPLVSAVTVVLCVCAELRQEHFGESDSESSDDDDIASCGAVATPPFCSLWRA